MTTLLARTETFPRPGGGLDGVFAAQVGERVAVLAIEVAPEGSSVTVRQAVTESPGYGAPAAALAALGTPFHAGARERLLLGLVDGDAREIAHSVAALSQGLPPLGRRGAPAWGKGRYDLPASPRENGGLRQGGTGADARHGVGVPHLALRLRGFATLPETLPPSVTGGSRHPSRRDLPAGGPNRDIPGMLPVPLIDFLGPWLEDLARVAHGHLRFLAPSTWTDATLGYFGAAGLAGAYRRQAGALYPAFSPLIASEGPVREAVDAGRPFEDALTLAAAALVAPGLRPGLTRAKLRRMRTLPPQPGIGKLAQILSLAARLPLHVLPAPGGWSEMAQRVGQIDMGADALGLPVRTLIGPRTAPWPVPGRPGDGGPEANSARVAGYLTELSHARDMADRCAETLAAPLLLGRRSHPRGRLLAARLLFGGLDVVQVGKLSRRWHLDLATFETALPPPRRDASSWPALFPPFAALGGITVECLTTPAELREDGAAMRHCVGGYALACHTGESHVASIRRGGERLSTASLQPMDGQVVVLAHNGVRNAAPPPEAVGALGDLVRAVLSGAVSLDPAAVLERAEDGYDDGRDWSDAATLARSLDAWRPYLPSRLSVSGVEGIRAALVGFEDGQAAEGEGTGLRRSGSEGIAQEP